MDTSTLLPGVQAFIRTVASECQAHGVVFSLENESRVQYGETSMRVSGYFIDRPSPALKVAVGKSQDQWLGVLVHEFGHMRQWIEASPAWAGVFMEDDREAGDWLDDWIQGTEFSPSRLKQIISSVQQVEYDCERRALQLIEAFDLPLDRDTYARRANAYVHFYEHIASTRRWYENGRAPYEIEALYGSMPFNLVPVDNGMPDEMRAVFDRHYPVNPAPSTPRP